MIKADKSKVELNGKGRELIAEFAMIYKSLLEEKIDSVYIKN